MLTTCKKEFDNLVNVWNNEFVNLIKESIVSIVKYVGCSDPRGVLDEGKPYLVEHKEVHSWHTKLYLKGFESLGFNSVCFEEID